MRRNEPPEVIGAGPTVGERFAVREFDDATLGANLKSAGVALGIGEARRVAEALGRDPSIVEAHAFAAQWSEHCSYKSSRHHLGRLPTSGPTVVLGPGEDAGIVHLGTWEGKRYGIVVAHESHNHPSQVVPFEGAATGIGGVVRDVLCMGARVVALADPLRFGPLDEPHSRYVAQGVVDGIAAYGNALGVPTIAGDVYVHEGFRNSVLVNVVALGVVEADALIHSKAPPDSAGWDIVLVGKATDRSGFGGAAFSSLSLDAGDAEANKGAVQVPDPFLENMIARASYRVFDVVREQHLTVGFKDLGAGGIMGATAELAGGGGFGARIDLVRCPTAQPGLPASVIAVGETQERLAWVVPPSFTPTLLTIYNDEFALPTIARGAQAAVIGAITAEQRYVLSFGSETVMDVPLELLTRGVRYDRPYELPRVARTGALALPDEAESNGGVGRGAMPPLEQLLACVLAHRDVCSRRTIYERFDSVVRGATSIPCGYADAGVILPVPGAPLGCALGVAGNPRYAVVDPERAAEHAVVEAIRNVVAVGAQPAGLTDCLNYGNPEDPRQMGEFVAGVDGLARAAHELGVPFVSGNVSFYNQSAEGRAIPASPIVACVGTLDDVSRSCTPALKRVGSVLYRLGRGARALGGSAVADVLGAVARSEPEHGARSWPDDWSDVPPVDYAATRREVATLLAAHRAGLVLAAHDVSDGGLLVALCEAAFAVTSAFGDTADRAGDMRIGIELEVELDLAAAFAESGAFVVETDQPEAFETLCARHGAAFLRLATTSDSAALRGPGFDADLAALREAWDAPLRDFYADVLHESAHA